MTGAFMDLSNHSPQVVIFLAAGVLVLWKTWHGWTLGLVRQVVSLVAQVGAWLCGIFAGHLAVPIVRGLLPVPELLLRLVSGIAVAVAFYLVVMLLGSLLFKKTEHQSVGVVRVMFGAGGALVGAVHGLLLVWLGVMAIRLLGSVAETQVALQNNPGFRKVGQPERRGFGSGTLHNLAALKQSLEQDTTGAVVKQLDPVPETIYTTLNKVTETLADRKRIERFAQYPGVQAVLSHPKITALASDPEIQRAATEGRFHAVLANPRLAALANDPEVAAALGKLEFEKALDFALGESGRVRTEDGRQWIESR